ncbi:MAG: tubulin-like doman-containing protein [Gemmataceae bacterium]
MSFVREANAEPIPGYRLIEPLGSGGFGEAWKCEAPGGILKAIKFVFGNLNSLDIDGARAEQELKALNRVKEIRHPFVLQMDRIEVVNGQLVIVMELADSSLHDAYEECKQSGLVGIPRDTLLRYIRDAAEALDHMNEKYGLQHLDIKPRNLFLVSDRVKVADFGLVKHLERSGASGVLSTVTPLYAPPETFTNAISDRSDQYSLAIVYQELLTGRRPFNGKSARQLAQQHLNEPPDLRALPEAERPVVGRALEKDPAKRFPSCLAFLRALYAARLPSVAGILIEGDHPGRPKSLHDTLESFQLEELSPADLPAAAIAGGPLNEANEVVSNLGVTVAQPATGALRPTLVIGVGGFGRRALLEIRGRFLDKFGDLDRVPMIRFLYLDTDLEAIKAAQRGASELALHSHEVFHLPLQQNTQYQHRRRQMEQLDEWLPREKLYTIPKSLKTEKSRALGRLAFTDHYQRLNARLKRELASACEDDKIFQTVEHTGLALRDKTPRVYVLSAATGGGSGFLPDLGFAVRRLLKASELDVAPVLGLLFCGAPDDPATPPAEQANLYATLTELYHFTDPTVAFAAQYGVDGTRMVEHGQPFDQLYLLPQPHRSPEARQDVLSQVGTYLFHELTTPLGLRLDQTRMRRDLTAPFRSLGTYGVWFPRGLLLRVAARDVCRRLLDEWQAGAGAPLAPAEQALLDAALARVLADPELRPDAIAGRLSELAAPHTDGPPRDALARLLSGIDEQSVQGHVYDDPGAWARQVLARVRDWLGGGVPLPGVSIVQQRRSPLTRGLEAAAAQLAEEWAEKLAAVVGDLTGHAGRRVTVGEAAVTRLMRFCEEAAQAHQARLQQQSARSAQGQQQLDEALQNCMMGAGAWSFFGGRTRRLLRIFLDHLAAFARQCLAEDTAAAVLQFFAALRGRLNDVLRDLGFCRQQLRAVQGYLTPETVAPTADTELLTDTMTFTREVTASGLSPQGTWAAPAVSPLLSTADYWEAISQASNNRVILPDGETDLEKAARRFLGTLTADHWAQLDHLIGEEILAPSGGLLKLCLKNIDLVRHFTLPLLRRTKNRLSDILPITDVAQVEYSSDQGLPARISQYHDLAAPPLEQVVRPAAVSPSHLRAAQGSGVRRPVLVGSGVGPTDVTPGPEAAPAGPPADQVSYLLIPASAAGKAFGEEAIQLIGHVQLVTVPGQADLMFCREQTGLRVEDLDRLLRHPRTAYHQLAVTRKTSPHARFDITDWMSLDP